jgi:regulator of sigma E protease
MLHSLFANVGSAFLIVFFFAGSIFVHELGHFLAARWRGMYVVRFSIGMGPPIWKWRGRDGVEYCISWIPIGGYVLLPQLAELGALEGKSEGGSESQPSVDYASLPPIDYASKMIVALAGVVFNLIFALLLATILWVAGQPEGADMATTRIGYILPVLDETASVPSPALQAGLRIGDEVRAIDGLRVHDWAEMQQTLYTGAGRGPDGQPSAVFTIGRDGSELAVPVRPRLSGDDRLRRIGILPYYDVLVGKVEPGSIADKAGLREGDVLQSVDGIPVHNDMIFSDRLEKAHGKQVEAIVRRDGENVPISLQVAPSAKSEELGLALGPPVRTVHRQPFALVGRQVRESLATLISLINPRSDVALSQMSGPVGIVHTFGEAAQSGLPAMLMFTVLLNVSLAIFNLLPIPALDGSHMLFATISWVRGRAMPLRFILATQSVFIVLLLSMIVYVSYFDINRWVHEAQAERSAAAAAKP